MANSGASTTTITRAPTTLTTVVSPAPTKEMADASTQATEEVVEPPPKLPRLEKTQGDGAKQVADARTVGRDVGSVSSSKPNRKRGRLESNRKPGSAVAPRRKQQKNKNNDTAADESSEAAVPFRPPFRVNDASFNYDAPVNTLPPLRKEWEDALKIDRSPHRVNQQSDTHLVLRGYIYPPVQLFLTTNRRFEYLFAWLAMRRQWMGEIAAAVYDLTCKRAPSPQTFKDQFRNMLGVWLPDLLAPKAASSGRVENKELTKAEKKRKDVAERNVRTLYGRR